MGLTVQMYTGIVVDCCLYLLRGIFHVWQKWS